MTAFEATCQNRTDNRRFPNATEFCLTGVFPTSVCSRFCRVISRGERTDADDDLDKPNWDKSHTDLDTGSPHGLGLRF